MKTPYTTHLAAILALSAVSSPASGEDAVVPGRKINLHTPALVAAVQPTQGNTAHGIVTFSPVVDGVAIHGTLRGLTPNSEHAFHIHEFGDASAADGTSAGGHFNPDDHKHGFPTDGERHAGDLGNLQANEEGIAVYDAVIKGITLTHGSHAILGRSLIVHAGADDGGQPTGNAGDRIAIGVIGYKHGHAAPALAPTHTHESASAHADEKDWKDKVEDAADSIGNKAKEALRRTGDALKTGAEKLDQKIEQATDNE